jgi:outer membrane autotransporter protein
MMKIIGWRQSIDVRSCCALRSRRIRLLAAALAGTCVTPLGAAAQTSNWIGTTAAYNAPGNWSAGIPSGTGMGIFASSPNTTIGTFAGVTGVGTWQFQAGAPAYTFNIDANFTFQGNGVVNNSSFAPTLNNIAPFVIQFSNSATAGNAAITNTGALLFQNNSTAGNATITNNGVGDVVFLTNSTAGNAFITNNAGLFFQNNSTAGNATIFSNNNLSFQNNSTAGNAAITNNAGAGVSFQDNSTAGNAAIINNNNLSFLNNSTAGNATITNNLFQFFANNSTAGNAAITNTGTVDFSGTSGPLANNVISAGSIAGTGTYSLGGNQLTVGGNNLSTAVSGSIQDGGGSGGTGASLVKVGTGTLTLSGVNTYSGGTTINGGVISVSADNNLGNTAGGLAFGGGALQTTATFTTARPVTLNAGGGTFIPNGGTTLTLAGAVGGAGGLTMAGGGTLVLAGASSYSGGTTVNAGALQLGLGASLFAGGALTVNGGTFNLNGNTQTVGTLSGTGGTIALGAGTLTTNSSANTTLATQITGTGGFGKQGSGALTLTGANTYSGGTTVAGGLINFAAASNFGAGAITLNGGGLQWATGNTADISSKLAPLGAGGGIFDTNGNNVMLASAITGSGGLAKQGLGTLNLTGNSTLSGGTAVMAGTLAVNGSIAGNVAVGASGTLGGNGTIGGNVVNAGTLAPGNSIGLLTVNGSYTQMAGSTYQVEANAQGQADRVNVGAAAAIQGGTVQVLAQPGNYGRSTTYTILNATGGVAGTYSGVTSNFAFLTPSLSYDANDVFLTLVLNSFSFGGQTFNQKAVGRVLDQTVSSASGDLATVLNAVAGLSTTQGPQILDAISGQNYAGFSNAMIQGAQLFMSNFANRAGSASGGGARVALAEACDVACDTTTPALWGAWGGAAGGTGTIAGNSNAGTFTYSVGGFSGGLDRKITDNFLAGVTVGYLTGGQWTGGFQGRSVTDTVQAGLYGSFLQGPVYVDALAAYAYNANQLWRPINIAGLQPRTAYGQTGANQFLGQIEAGYRIELGGTPGYFVTPFALLQGSVTSQNGFTETGAQSLNLSVAQQTTSSIRTIFGAQVGAAMDVGLRDKIAAQLRLGWSHEYSDTARPVTASFVGAPAVPFTVFGAAPTRDGAAIGFSLSTAVAEAMSLYVRYEGNIAGQDSSHALTAGLRMSW